MGVVVVTGAAGFIGAFVARALLARGERVVGVDCLTRYYDIELKRRRLAAMTGGAGEAFEFVELDVADHAAVAALFAARPEIDRIVHLAAQAGVRWSLQAPFAYSSSNLVGHLSILEAARGLGDRLRHIVYASTSSVYGSRSDGPFRETDRVERPASLYAATKIGGEMMSRSYADLYGLPITALRFFTVYGPWGRPDMAYWLFTDALLAGRPIELFNNGAMKRDFTYIDDVVAGVLAVLDSPADRGVHRIYNVGNNKPETLGEFVEILEELTGTRAIRVLKPMQAGDVPHTSADIAAMESDFGWRPTIGLREGLGRFVDWWFGYFGRPAKP